MKELHLEAKTPEEERIKTYLNENASETLRKKIENGAPYKKDNLSLINCKTLSGFMEYAYEEARKRAAKGARSACIEDRVVFGWAIHYFEEDSIVGTLYNTDGTPYQSELGKHTPEKITTIAVQGKPAERTTVPTIDKNQVPGQSSFFDFLPPEEQPQANEDTWKPDDPEWSSKAKLDASEEAIDEEVPVTPGTVVTDEPQTTDTPATEDFRTNPYLYIDENGELHEVDQTDDDRILKHICETFSDGILLRW